MPIHPYTRLFPAQSIPPTIDDDSSAGYEIGDWWHVVGGSLYTCRDDTAGAAVWDEMGAGGGGAVDSVNGQTGTVVLDADDISDSGTTHKFTTAAEITKLAGIASGAEVNVNADWNAISGDAQILNKPTIPSQYTDELAQDAIGAMIADTDTVDLTYTDATPELKADVKKQMSITSDSSGLKLSGDSATPGNNKVYGTDGSGTKGWKNDPSGGSSSNLASAKYQRTTGNYTTSSTSFANVDGTNMALTITTGARRVLIGFAGFVQSSAGNRTISFDVDLDGTRMGNKTYGYNALTVSSTWNGNAGFTILSDVLSAGSHTFTLMWRTEGDTATLFGSATAPCMFFVVELPLKDPS